VAGKVTVEWQVPGEVALLAGTAAGLLLGAAFGALVVRLQRYYLAIATFALIFVLSYAYINFDELTGGVNGFPVPPAEMALLGGAQIDADYAKYFVGLLLVVVMYVVHALMQRSAAGRGWRVVHQDERIASALGISPYRSKLAAFTVSAGVMALAGAWFVFTLGTFLPGSFTGDELLFNFLIVVFGGLGSLNGAVVGSVALVIAREYLRDVPGASEVLFGFVLLGTALLMRHGIYGALARRWPALREGVA
jgi:branched-chain amino acid transport system permease protein